MWKVLEVVLMWMKMGRLREAGWSPGQQAAGFGQQADEKEEQVVGAYEWRKRRLSKSMRRASAAVPQWEGLVSTIVPLRQIPAFAIALVDQTLVGGP